MSRNLAVVFVIGLLIIAALTGWGVVNALRLATEPTVDLTSGLETRTANLVHPTPTIVLDGPMVIRAVRPLARLETVTYSVEKVITAEEGQDALAFLFGDRLLFVAHGEVIAGVDLSRLQEGDIVAAGGGRVVVTLPTAEVFTTALDNDKSYVYDRDTGLFTKGDVNLETEAPRAAEEAILEAAVEDGILTTAQSNAERYLESLIESLGFTEVVFVIATAVQ